MYSNAIVGLGTSVNLSKNRSTTDDLPPRFDPAIRMERSSSTFFSLPCRRGVAWCGAVWCGVAWHCVVNGGSTRVGNRCCTLRPPSLSPPLFSYLSFRISLLNSKLEDIFPARAPASFCRGCVRWWRLRRHAVLRCCKLQCNAPSVVSIVRGDALCSCCVIEKR